MCVRGSKGKGEGDDKWAREGRGVVRREERGGGGGGRLHFGKKRSSVYY
jgi:hypothetical protein